MPDPKTDLRPICFMVMPFRRKKVGEPRSDDAPPEVDFDALWDKALRPAIERLGYLPVRADYDPGTVIIKDMLERLALADLVLADVSLPNGNVYYEVGLRHVAKETHCVMLAAEWSRQLFDIDQFTAIRYPLTDGNVPDAEAKAIQDILVAKVPALERSRTPYHEFVFGPADELARRGVFRDQVRRLSAFQARVREVRLLRDKEARKGRLQALEQDIGEHARAMPDVAIELLCLIRDEIGWEEALEFVDKLPEATRALPVIREQSLLALAKTGSPEQAIARLEELVKEIGDSAERQGLIGGRYKELWRSARKARIARTEERPAIEEKRHLEKAIEHYQLGMELDYNQYYCSCNLPQLLRARGRRGDEQRAAIIDHFVVAACERAQKRGELDPWLRPTLLGAAFRTGDLDKAQELAERVALEGAAQWHLVSTLNDLADAVKQTKDDEAREALQAIYDELAALVP
mgnify:CR=1 FL=1